MSLFSVIVYHISNPSVKCFENFFNKRKFSGKQIKSIYPDENEGGF